MALASPPASHLSELARGFFSVRTLRRETGSSENLHLQLLTARPDVVSRFYAIAASSALSSPSLSMGLQRNAFVPMALAS